MLSALFLSLAIAAPAPAASAGASRVFFATLAAGAGATKDETALIGEALLVEARRHADRWDVIGTQDLTSILDVEASKQAMGCDAISCASEIADALNAPQIVQGTLGHVGATWVLTLSRIERSSLGVVARAQVQAEGEHPDVLLPRLGVVVDGVLGAPPGPSVPLLTLAGGGVAAAGVLGLGVAGVLYFFAWRELEAGRALPVTDEKGRLAHQTAGEPLYFGSIVAVVAGGALVIGGLALAGAGLAFAGDAE